MILKILNARNGKKWDMGMRYALYFENMDEELDLIRVITKATQESLNIKPYVEDKRIAHSIRSLPNSGYWPNNDKELWLMFSTKEILIDVLLIARNLRISKKIIDSELFKLDNTIGWKRGTRLNLFVAEKGTGKSMFNEYLKENKDGI